MERRLAAILAADVVGYSRLMEEDEAGTVTAFKAHRDELIDTMIAEYHGRVVRLMGDGILIEFASVVKAVECAVGIQRGMFARNVGLPEAQRIVFRIGINVGDIIVEDDDIHGDGVNIAARLEGLAAPGGICISGKVYEEVRNKLHYGFEDLGEHEVKNIVRPVRTYRVHTDRDAAREAARVTRKRSWSWRFLAAGVATVVLIAGIAVWLMPQRPDGEPGPSSDALTVVLTPAQLQQIVEALGGPGGAQGRERADVRQLSRGLGVTESAVRAFFVILGEKQVPLEDLDAKLREIAVRHKALQNEVRALRSDDPEVAALKTEAARAVENAAYDRAEDLLMQAESVEIQRALQAQVAANQQFLNAAATRAERGQLKLTQLDYAAAAKHLKAAADLVPDSASTPKADYLNRLGGAFRQAGDYPSAEDAYERALEIRDASLGPNHPDVATSLNNLALLYDAQGRYGEAVPLHQRARKIWEAALGPEHLQVATSLNNLAGLYETQGRYTEAEPLYQRSLKIIEKARGPEHLSVATALNNLAELYRAQGRYELAEPLYERSLEIIGAMLGLDHPSVATILNNLGLLYKLQGRADEAEPLYARALRIKETVLSPDHPSVATSLNNLAELYRAQGRFNEAEPLYERSLNIKETALGPNHPDVATGLNKLGELYRAQGRYEEAEPLYERSLKIIVKAVGPNHPSVATTLNDLGLLFWSQGRYPEAKPLLKRSLEINEKAFGPQHRAVAVSLNNLALVFRDQGRYGEGESLFKRSLLVYRNTVGPEHPNVGRTLNHLALLYVAQGRYQDAELLYRSSLEILESTLSSKHPWTVETRKNLAFLMKSIKGAEANEIVGEGMKENQTERAE